MNKLFRTRNYLLVGGSLLVLLYLFFSDPNGGALTTALLGQLATPILAVWFAHLARKALFDYLDLRSILHKAQTTAMGAAIVFLGVCLVVFALLGLFGNQVKAQEATVVPNNAITYLPLLKSEQERFWADHPKLGCWPASLSTRAASV